MIHAEQLNKVPKVELHCHLDGSISIDFLHKLYTQKSMDELRREVMAPNRCRDLAEYLNCFKLLTSALGGEIRLILAVLDIAKQAVKENVVYIELRFSPLYVRTEELTEEQAVQAVLKGIELAHFHYGIEIGLILCLMRGKDNSEVFELAAKYHNLGVVGIDLAGNELKYGFLKEDIALFEKAKVLGLPFTVHAGETGCVENVLIAVKLGAKRIGHGIAAAQSEEAMYYIREKEVTVELCPVCNIQTGASSSWEDYPYQLFSEKGLRVTINTDNRTVSNTNLNKEFLSLSKYFDLDLQDVRELSHKALESAFLPEDKIKKIHNQMQSIN